MVRVIFSCSFSNRALAVLRSSSFSSGIPARRSAWTLETAASAFSLPLVRMAFLRAGPKAASISASLASSTGLGTKGRFWMPSLAMPSFWTAMIRRIGSMAASRAPMTSSSSTSRPAASSMVTPFSVPTTSRLRGLFSSSLAVGLTT
jgi:hypothetical protein